MKNKKTIIVVVIGVLALVSFIGVVTYNGVKYAGNYQSSIYEDDSKIIAKGDSYSYIYKTSTTNAGTLKSKFSLTGMDTIFDLYTDEASTIKIDYDVNITSGQFKMVLINPHNEITTILEESGEGTKEIALESGESRIKLVGKDAKCEIVVGIISEDNVEINSEDD